MAVRLLVAASALLVLALAGCSDSDVEVGAEVAIHQFKFDPSSVTVSHGEAVKFTNHEGTTHTATADNGAFDTGDLGEGDSKVVEVKAGTYAYHCKYHSSMRGTLVVS